MTDKKVIEVKVTAEHIEELRSREVPEAELPQVGTIKRYRPSPHIIKKTPVFLDSKVIEHFKKKNSDEYQTAINKELADLIKSKETKQSERENLREELLNDEEFLRKLRQKLAA